MVGQTTFGFIGVLLLAALLPAGAAAHQPWFNTGSPDPNQPYALRTPLTVSQVVYGGFTGPDQVDFFRFTAPSGFPIDVNLVTDDDEACAAFRPAFVVIGPGIDSAASHPTSIPDIEPAPRPDEGAVAIAEGEWEEFYERFAGVTFVRGPAFTGNLTGGDYLVAVFDPDGGEGVYGLTLGGEEVVGGEADFFSRFAPWSRCQPMRGADLWDPAVTG